MTTAPIKPNAPIPARPQPGAASAGTPTIDIGKMLQKYLWLLLGAFFAGIFLGTGAFFVLRQVYPIFEAQVVFQVLPPQEGLETIQTQNDEDEQERFALTQVAQMQSDDVVRRVVSDPRLVADGGAWAQKFMQGGAFQSADAIEWLQDNLTVRLVPQTDIIEMKLGWTDPAAITNVLSIVKETYMLRLDEQARSITAPQRDALEREVQTLQERIDDKQRLREQILRDDKVDSLEQRWAAENLELQGIIGELHETRINRQSFEVALERYERELNSPAGPTYSDELISAVEADPQVMSIRQNISALQTSEASMKLQGFGPEHRSMVQIRNQIQAWNAELDRKKQELLALRFAGIVDGTRNYIASLAATETDLAARQERLVTRLVDLSRTLSKVDDLDNEIAGIFNAKTDRDTALQNLNSVARLATSKRVAVLQSERKPDRPVFPDILYMIPGGIILCMGLTGGFAFLRELLDQRVKGPSDVALIPRTRILGFVPDAAEDSATPGDQTHRALSVAPRGVIAESFRQIRSPLLKQMDLAGHRSVMVMCGMPQSGASTVASNLAEASAAAGRRTLLIDANFRRPRQHGNFGLADAPGLADVLDGTATVESAASATDTEHLFLLPAGTASIRIVERLAGESFSGALASATAAFDLVVIDVPPAIVAGDGLSVANHCDASVLVVKAYAEKRGLVARLRNQMGDAKAEFLGVVVNRVKASAGGYLRGNIRASEDYVKDA